MTYYIVNTNLGPLYRNRRNFCLGGKTKEVFIPIFADRDDAFKISVRMEEKPNNKVNWTEIIKCKIIQEVN